ncbi:hypothetical protein DIT71_09280 [Marinobacter vulgaris]|uniref:Acyltransferase 3 domain-containing protein n=1 Tax=Marinobacter vulgaris TaxID=1928331 RepID=A0A2V3ZJK0_9GAMM|nr:acyltransferase family protein [Marinobacter vulgaris]PXX90729.1 hypothetical protein DIT71_09280 [Marinobacter vulgaris]TSJ70297.1 acyltransferase [Marinobacter vulgaris]
MTKVMSVISSDDRIFIDRLRGLSIIRVVLVHLGLSWFLTPYSQFIHVFLPILFFVSGAISYPVYLRAESIRYYSFKRLLSIIIPYYLIVGFIVSIYYLFFASFEELSPYTLARWFLVSPATEMMPFNLGQIWFLRALIIIILISIPLFLFARVSLKILAIPIFISIILSASELVWNISSIFYIGFFNFYQPIVNMGFFFFGAYYYAAAENFSSKKLSLLFLISLFLSYASFKYFDLDLNMANHTFSPNLYYISLSFAVIFLVLLLKPVIQLIFEKIKIIDKFVGLYSKHAYGVFIIHSFLIHYSEVEFGWENVASDPLRAIFKVSFVLFGSLLIAIPVTKITKPVTSLILRNVNRK